MGRIAASLSSTELLLLNRLARAESAAAVNSLRLATGKRIQLVRDDPGGFVQLSALQSQLALTKQTTKNVAAATGVVSQVQLTLDQIRTQIEAIRADLLEDEDGGLTAQQRADKQEQIDAALDAVADLAGTSIAGRTLLAGGADFRTSGRNPSQVARLTVFSTGGSVQKQAAQPAELTFTGASGLVTVDSTIDVIGKGGAVRISVDTSTTLAELAAAVNDRTDTTGVVAEAVGDELFFRSAASEKDDFVRVLTVSGTAFEVTGGEDGQSIALATEPVHSSGPGLFGSVSQAAIQAKLTYEAGGATIGSDLDFTLTGRLGTAAFSVLASESLSLDDFATRLNNQSHNTGVVASVDGTDVVLTSVDYGTAAEVTVVDNGATFTTLDEQGNPATTDRGTNLVATVNGRLRTGSTFATAAELVHQTSGSIENDAVVQIEGPKGTATITIDTGADDTLTGLRDAINAETGSTGVLAQVDGNDLYLRTEATGADATLQVRVTSGSFAVDGGNGDGTASGQDASTLVDGNRLTIIENGLHAEIEFAPGFTGSFSPVSIEPGGLQFALFNDLARPSRLTIPTLGNDLVGGVSGVLSDLRTGGSAAGLADNTSRALRIVDQALGQLARVEGRVDGFANSAIAAAAALSSETETNLQSTIDSIDAVDENAESLLQAKNEALASNAVASLAVLQQQRQRIVDLIQQIAGLG